VDSRPIWMPDTSAINALADDSDSEALIAGLSVGYFVRFPFEAVSEVIATTCGARRKELLRVCRRLLRSAGDCIEPHHEILKTMVARFEKSLPLGVQHVNLRMVEAENEICSQENFDDELSTQEREEGRVGNKKFDGAYAGARAAFDKVAGLKMANGVAELVYQLQQGGAFWVFARNLYERVATKAVEDATIQKFYAQCEAFRVLMIAVFAAEYDRCIRQPSDGRSLRAGRIDTFMVTCLPYCDEFITNDDGQLACYAEVISVAEIKKVTIRSYEDFRNGFSVGAAVSSAR
jgi:hypothetical protein